MQNLNNQRLRKHLQTGGGALRTTQRVSVYTLPCTHTDTSHFRFAANCAKIIYYRIFPPGLAEPEGSFYDELHEDHESDATGGAPL